MVDAARVAPIPILDGPLPKCKGYQQINAATLSAVSTLTVPNGTTMALLQAEAGSVRWRGDEVNPTSSVGMLIAEGGEVLYATGQSSLAAIRFIAGSAGAILNISYY